MRVLRIISAICLATALLVLLVAAVKIASLSGGGVDGIIKGLTIEERGTLVRITGQHLDCTNTSQADVASATCQADILGDPLTVDVVRHPMNHFTFSDCVVHFRSEDSNCYAKTYTVTGEPDATITGLNLSTNELETLHQEHLLASRDEGDWRGIITWIATIIAACCLLAGATWVSDRWYRRIPLSVACGIGGFTTTYMFMILLLLSAQFID